MKCRTIKCEDEGGNRTGYCTKCQAGFRYWEAKRPAEVLERSRKLTIYQSRVRSVIADRGISEK